MKTISKPNSKKNSILPLGFLSIVGILLSFRSHGFNTHYPKPNLKISVTILGKVVPFLGVLGSDLKNTVPIYSANCDSGDCAALQAAKKANPKLVNRADRKGGQEPSLILCEKLGGELTPVTLTGRNKPSIFCHFEDKNEAKNSYIDPFALWALALEQKR